MSPFLIANFIFGRVMEKQSFIIGLFIGVALMTASAAQAKSEPVNALVALGDQQWKQGKLDEAKKTFKSALTAEPTSIDAHMKLAGLQLSSQDFKGCIQTYQDVISLDSNNGRAWLGLGFSYLHLGKNSLSLAAFNEAIRIDPTKKETLQPVLSKLQAP